MEPDLLSTFELTMPPAIEWWAVGLAIIYVILAARNSAWCWPFAFVSSCLWAWQVWFAYSLLFDAALNIFYAVMAIWGAWRWLTHAGGHTDDSITTISTKQHLLTIGFGVSASILLGYFASVTTIAALSYLDALTTVFSIMATLMLIERKLENWIYFLVMDIIYVYLYLDRGSVIFAGLFVVYCIMAVIGYLNWKKIRANQVIA